ncbi:MAG TPA: acyl carrier protein [Candidatus Baltobacteraceae bacterium]|jgi:acyl carrier protein
MSDGIAPADRLSGIVAGVLRIERSDITDGLDMEETGTWDSLSHMELIAAIEDEFGVELTADEIVAMRSVGTIKSVLRDKSIAL